MDLYGKLYKFVIGETQKFLDHTETRETHYVLGEKYKRQAKILNLLSKRIYNNDLPTDRFTMYDRRIKELELLWEKDHPPLDDNIGFLYHYYIEKVREDYISYSSVEETKEGELYFKLRRLKYKHLDGIEKNELELFHKYLKHFNNISW